MINRPGRDDVTVARYEVPGKVSEGGAVPAGTIEEKSREIRKHKKITLYYLPIDENNYFDGAHILFPERPLYL